MELCNRIQSVARYAGRIMLEASNIKEALSSKAGHGNFVTEYDKKIQEFLISELGKILPEANFVGEEEGQEGFREVYRKGYAFVIDPIDGTTNFIKAYRPSVTSIGLLKDGRPYAGVIYNPYDDQMFSAVRGEGAYLNGKRIHTSEESLKDSLVSVGTAPYYPELWEKSFRLAARYLEHCADIRRSGSAAWDLCQVACGVSGLFFEYRLGLWDYCAGALIVEEAGGKVTDIDGKQLTYDGPSSLTAVSSGAAEEEYLF